MKEGARLFKTGEIMNNRYIIKRKIGQGGMSEVYLAYDTFKNGPAALKCSWCNMPLAKEYHIMKSLHCNGIPEVFELFEYGGIFIMALEYIEGCTLGEAVENRHMAGKINSCTELIRIIINVCMTADYLHREKGMLYLDYKPSNIIAGSKGTFLIDFGAAADLKDTYQGEGIALYGTERYAAPEQRSSGRTVNVCTDIYLIGALIQYIIRKCGVRDRVVKGIVKRCMDRKMSARYSSAKEVAALLSGCINYDGRIY